MGAFEWAMKKLGGTEQLSVYDKEERAMGPMTPMQSVITRQLVEELGKRGYGLPAIGVEYSAIDCMYTVTVKWRGHTSKGKIYENRVSPGLRSFIEETDYFFKDKIGHSPAFTVLPPPMTKVTSPYAGFDVVQSTAEALTSTELVEVRRMLAAFKKATDEAVGT